MGFSVMLWGAEKLVPAEYWCPYAVAQIRSGSWGDTLGFFPVRRQPQKSQKSWWLGGGGGLRHFFSPWPQIFLLNTHSRGTHVSQTSMTSKKKIKRGKKGPQRRRANMKKGSSFQLIIIKTQNRGGGGGRGHLILCPPPSKSWGGGTPWICAHALTVHMTTIFENVEIKTNLKLETNYIKWKNVQAFMIKGSHWKLILYPHVTK